MQAPASSSSSRFDRLRKMRLSVSSDSGGDNSSSNHDSSSSFPPSLSSSVPSSRTVPPPPLRQTSEPVARSAAMPISANKGGQQRQELLPRVRLIYIFMVVVQRKNILCKQDPESTLVTYADQIIFIHWANLIRPLLTRPIRWKAAKAHYYNWD